MVQSNLKLFREKANLTQEALAELMNTTKTTIYRLESGRQPFDEHWIISACKVLKCKVKDMFDFELTEPMPAGASEIHLHGHIEHHNMLGRMMWVCSGCGTHYAPHVDKCDKCSRPEPSKPHTKPKTKEAIV